MRPTVISVAPTISVRPAMISPVAAMISPVAPMRPARSMTTLGKGRTSADPHSNNNGECNRYVSHGYLLHKTESAQTQWSN